MSLRLLPLIIGPAILLPLAAYAFTGRGPGFWLNVIYTYSVLGLGWPSSSVRPSSRPICIASAR